MKRVYLTVFLVALTTLVVELALTRTFDVILTPNMAYMVVTCALFAFGLAGIQLTLRPLQFESAAALHRWLARETALFGLLTALVLPAVNAIPFDFDRVDEAPLRELLLFAAMYLVIVGPFFVAGRILAGVFSNLPGRIQRLYFFDLTGAALGCLILVPFLPGIGPGGLLLCSGGLGLGAAALLEPRRGRIALWAGVGVVLLALPFLREDGYYDFVPKQNKRGVLAAQATGRIELTRWDPVSKIDVIDMAEIEGDTGAVAPGSDRKHVGYDGGSQSTHIYHFDGDYRHLRDNLRSEMMEQFWNLGVLASHWIKRDSGQRVLVVGSAGGQETKAALMFGAERVDAVEMVGTVVRLGLETYAGYNGGVFRHPNVRVHVGEGRSFLRASDERYDIIQIYSNHTSSSIAAGTGAMATSYLQTADAYREYFTHLAGDGILHVNHHIYPRIVVTAASAWRQLGRGDFERHVVVYKRDGPDNIPTILVKMRPWTAEELADLERLFLAEYEHEDRVYSCVENPLDRKHSFLADEFFAGSLSHELLERLPYRVTAPTDDRPYFNFVRRNLDTLERDPERYVSASTASYLNRSLRGGRIPMDVAHLAATGIVSLSLAALFILLPLALAPAGRAPWPGKYSTLLYFACLGAGFIMVELVFIQIFMKLIGPPLHTYSTVLFTMLFAAGLGSALSEKLGRVAPRGLPFAAILLLGAALLASYESVFHLALAFSLPARILVAALLMLPVGVFMGMPFPLGILELERRPRGAIAWAWGLNGLFTVIGGLASVVLSIFVGFRFTLVVAFAIYAVALVAFVGMRRAGAVGDGRPSLAATLVHSAGPGGVA